MSTAQTSPGGYTVSKHGILTRLARIEGQVRGVARMVEEDRPCVDVLQQIGAIQAALDKVSLGLLDGHVRDYMRRDSDDAEDASTEPADELMGAVGRLLGH